MSSASKGMEASRALRALWLSCSLPRNGACVFFSLNLGAQARRVRAGSLGVPIARVRSTAAEAFPRSAGKHAAAAALHRPGRTASPSHVTPGTDQDDQDTAPDGPQDLRSPCCSTAAAAMGSPGGASRAPVPESRSTRMTWPHSGSASGGLARVAPRGGLGWGPRAPAASCGVRVAASCSGMQSRTSPTTPRVPSGVVQPNAWAQR